MSRYSALHTVTAHNRELAFQSINEARASMAQYRAAQSAEDRSFELDVMRDCISFATSLRLARVDYPRIP